MRALTNADIAFRFFGVVSLDYTKVIGAFLSLAIAAAFILGPAVVNICKTVTSRAGHYNASCQDGLVLLCFVLLFTRVRSKKVLFLPGYTNGI